MKMKKLVALMLSAIMLVMFATAANANPISNSYVITGQGTLKVTGTAYFNQGSCWAHSGGCLPVGKWHRSVCRGQPFEYTYQSYSS